jgi:hypothetical protein
MPYRIAGIDVHKKMLAVVVSDVEVDSEYQFERRMFGSNPEQLRSLAAWLLEQEVQEVVMESTAQYWKPVWEALERYWKPIREKREGARRRSGTLHLAQALSNRGRQGRKRDFLDAERLVKRLVARELTLSFVPDPEQRLWRTVTRKKYQSSCRYSSNRSANWTRRWPLCSTSTRTQSRGWQRCRVWEWIQRNRSLLKLVPLRRPFRRGNSSPRGWAPAPATKRAQA